MWPLEKSKKFGNLGESFLEFSRWLPEQPEDLVLEELKHSILKTPS